MLALIFFTNLVWPSSVSQDILLLSRMSYFIEASPTAEVHVQNSAVVKVQEHPKGLKLTAKKKGNAYVTVDRKIYHIHIVSKKLFSIYSQVWPLTKSNSSLKIKIDGEKLLLKGKVSNWRTWKKITQAVIDSKDLKTQIQFSSEVFSKIKEETQKKLFEFQLPPVTLISSPELTALLPPMPKEREQLYRKVLAPLLIKPVLHNSLINPGKTIELSLLIAEVKKGALLRYGLKWPSQIQADFLPEKNWLTNEQSRFQLDALETKGDAKILASPRLLSSSGEKASFIAGGELPIRSGKFGGDVFWKKHGILLSFTPIVDPKNQLQLKIEVEVSSPDFSQAIDGLPGFSTHRVSTNLKMKEPHTIAISGLYRMDESKNRQGLPFLSRLPIIGPLFSSQDFQKRQSELLILISPKIISQRPGHVSSSPR